MTRKYFLATVPTVAERPATIGTVAARPPKVAASPYTVAERPTTIGTIARWLCMILLSASQKGYIPH